MGDQTPENGAAGAGNAPEGAPSDTPHETPFTELIAGPESTASPKAEPEGTLAAPVTVRRRASPLVIALAAVVGLLVLIVGALIIALVLRGDAPQAAPLATAVPTIAPTPSATPTASPTPEATDDLDGAPAADGSSPQSGGQQSGGQPVEQEGTGQQPSGQQGPSGEETTAPPVSTIISFNVSSQHLMCSAAPGAQDLPLTFNWNTTGDYVDFGLDTGYFNAMFDQQAAVGGITFTVTCPEPGYTEQRVYAIRTVHADEIIGERSITITIERPVE